MVRATENFGNHCFNVTKVRLAISGTEKPRPMSDNDNFLGLANNKVINIFFRKVLKKLKKVDKYTRDCPLV